jgi:putative SOS response-associated peptidase YedK
MSQIWNPEKGKEGYRISRKKHRIFFIPGIYIPAEKKVPASAQKKRTSE